MTVEVNGMQVSPRQFSRELLRRLIAVPLEDQAEFVGLGEDFNNLAPVQKSEVTRFYNKMADAIKKRYGFISARRK